MLVIDSVSIVKFISLFVYPVGLITLCFFIAMLSRIIGFRKLSAFSLFLCLAVFFVASSPLISIRLVASLERQFPQLEISQVPNADTILVLGGGLKLPIEPRQYSQLTSGSDRYWLAATLYKNNKAPELVLSGGNVFEQTGMRAESYYAKTLLQAWGVPEPAIRIEDASRTTAQNAVLSKSKLDGQDKVILLVTSAWHMPRALREFADYEANIVPVSADVIVDKAQSPSFYRWVPSSSAITRTTIALHEYYGIWYSEIRRLLD